VVSGGRTWWAHVDFTRILRKKIEDVREARTTLPNPAAFVVTNA
jgi:hypothetical protein